MKKLYFYLAAAVSIAILSGCKEPALNGRESGNETAEVLKTAEEAVSEGKVQNTVLEKEKFEETISPVETAKEDILLTSAPEISLTDSLSSTINQFKLQSGSYSWNYKEGKEVTGIVACGLHPLDTNIQKEDKLSVPKYNGMDYVSYTVSFVIPSDRLIVREWAVSRLGDTEAAPNAEIIYEDEFFIKLKPNMIYEITAQWDKEKLEANGFYGEASYGFITE